MNKEYVVCMQNYVLFSYKKKEILSFVIQWVSLEDFMLSEITQGQKLTQHVISLLNGI